jgi:hypothetical protein
MLENGTTSSEESSRRDGFLHSLQVLEKLKRLSPQAEQYYGILTNFSQAIDAYKEQQRHRMKQAQRGSLVDQLFLPPNNHRMMMVNNYHDIYGNQGAGSPGMGLGTTTQLPTPADMTTTTGLDPSSPSTWTVDNMGSFGDMLPAADTTLNGEGDVIMRMLWDGYGVDYPDFMLAQTDMEL